MSKFALTTGQKAGISRVENYWRKVAEERHYDNPRDLLVDAYAKYGSLKKLGKHFGKSDRTIARAMTHFRIPVRPSGGSTFGRKGQPSSLRSMPWDLLYSTSPRVLAERCRVSVQAVYAMRKKRLKEKEKDKFT